MKTPARLAKTSDRASPAVAGGAEASRAPAAGGGGARPDFAPIQRQVAPEPDRPDGLPAPLRGSLEALSGMSLGHVTVRYNSPAPAKVGALAYARGHEIHLGRGQEQHLAHEAWHIVQQARRQVRTTGKVAGQSLNDDHGLEREADRMGARAASMAQSAPTPSAPADVAAPPAADAPLQPMWKNRRGGGAAKPAAASAKPAPTLKPATPSATAAAATVADTAAASASVSAAARMGDEPILDSDTEDAAADRDTDESGGDSDGDGDGYAAASPTAGKAAASSSEQNRKPNEKRWATDPLRAEAIAMHAAMSAEQSFGGKYTLHHKVSKASLRTLGRLIQANNGPAAVRFKAAARAASHVSARGFELEHQLVNMPMNIELGPNADIVRNNTNDSFDPNTVAIPAGVAPVPEVDLPDAADAEDKRRADEAAAKAAAAAAGAAGPASAPQPQPQPQQALQQPQPPPKPPLKRSLTRRSAALKPLAAMISGSSNHWDLSEAGIDLMTGAINAAQAAHAAPVQDKPVLSAPRTEQWKAYDDDDGRKYVRRGGGPAGAGSGAASGARAVAYNAHIKMVQKAVEDNERDAAEAEATARRRRDAVSKLRDKVRHSNMPKATFENLAKAHGLKAEESGDILKNLDKIRRDLAGKKQVKTPEVTAHLTKHFPVKSSAAASPAAASPAVASPTAAATSSDKVEEVD